MAHHKEGKVERYFCEQVKLAGGITRKARWIGRRGCPDQFWAFPPKNIRWSELNTVAVAPSRYGYAEIKAPGEPLEPHQEREIGRLRGWGVLVYVISSTEDVDHFIRSETQ